MLYVIYLRVFIHSATFDFLLYTDLSCDILCTHTIPVNMPELGRFWADAASIGTLPAQFWHIMACLQG